MSKKVKLFLNKNINLLITFALTNRLFLAFIILSQLETMLLGILTLGADTWGFKAAFFDFAIILILGAIGYLFKPKKQYRYFMSVLILITVICLVNSIYFTFYNSFVTIGLLESLGQVNTVTDAVIDKLTPLHGIYIFFPIAFFLINKSLSHHNYFNFVCKIEKSKKNFGTVLLVGVIVLCMNIVTLNGTDVSRLLKQWYREYIVERYGILTYQINDIFQSTQAKLFSYFGYDDAVQKFLEFYRNKDTQKSNNQYTNIFKGKNMLFIHMESMMTMFINMKINDIEVTPNLNKLASEGLYFSNFYPQVSAGTSSDTEFTLNTSLMPALSGTVFVTYHDRNYLSLEKLLKEQNYYTFSMHGNNSTMWNRAVMHKSLGYDKFYSKEFFDVTNENWIGLGISDHDFFKQSIPYLKEIEENNEQYMGTMITLTNHTPWDGGDAYGEFDLTYNKNVVNEETGEIELATDTYLDNKKIGNFIKSVHYADKCIGEFINYLYEYNIFNNTVLILYGDHDSKIASKEYNYLYNYDPELGKLRTMNDEGYVPYDYYANELNRKTPLIMWTKDKKVKGTIDYYMGMIDVLPTLGNMFGFENKYALGHDIFQIKNNNIVVFPNGNFVTENVYYNNSKGQYKVLKESAIIDETYIEEQKKYSEEILEISNDIIVYDLIESEGENIDNETT